MSGPLGGWDDKKISHEKLVWSARFDERFWIEVQSIGEFTADLVIYDHNNNNEELLREGVQLCYEAAFGPDADDVYAWKQRVIRFIDTEFKK